MNSRIKGFTLLEILIALTIFSIMAVIASTVLYSVFNARDRTTQHAIRLSELQITMVLMERDITQMLKRPLVLNKNTIEFTRGGLINPLGYEKKSSLTRVMYQLTNTTLVRISHPFRLSLNEPSLKNDEEPLLTKVKQLSFKYIDNRFQTHDEWLTKNLPQAIRVTLTLEDWGEISVLYMLPQAYRLSLFIKNTKDKLPKGDNNER